MKRRVLTEAEQRTRADLLLCLSTLDSAASSKERLRGVMGMLNACLQEQGWAGVVDMCIAAVEITYDQVLSEVTRADLSIGSGWDADLKLLKDNQRQTVVAFINAVLIEDLRAAHRVFDTLQPGQDDPLGHSAALVITALMGRAYNGLRGRNRLLVNYQPTKDWPPTCDFCAAERGAWMFELRGLEIYQHYNEPVPATDDTPAIPASVVGVPDPEHWYACTPCRRLVEFRPHPRWNAMYRRLPTDRISLAQAMSRWRVFARHVVSPRATAMPDSRPPCRIDHLSEQLKIPSSVLLQQIADLTMLMRRIDSGEVTLMLCYPVDRTCVPDLPGFPMPAPTAAHRVVNCCTCRQPMWIGSDQSQLPRGVGICLRCLVIAMSLDDRLDIAGMVTVDDQPSRT